MGVAGLSGGLLIASMVFTDDDSPDAEVSQRANIWMQGSTHTSWKSSGSTSMYIYTYVQILSSEPTYFCDILCVLFS